jgi:excisionase family DNA binding protein
VPDEPQESMTPAQASAFLGFSPVTLAGWERAGKLKAEDGRAPGRRRRYLTASVKALREELGRTRAADGTAEVLLTSGEVAGRFRVDPKTVQRWAATGRISSIRTPGGHRRFRESEIRALMRGGAEGTAEP